MTFALISKLLFNRFTLLVVVVVAVLLGLNWLYHHVENQGAQRERDRLGPVIAKLEVDLRHERKVNEAALKTNQNQREAHKLALEALEEDQALVLKAVGDQLTLTQQHVKELEKHHARQVIQASYVTARADAACVVPRGFVRLHNEAAGQPGDSSRPAQAAALPPGGPTDADAASGVALSEVGGTVAGNYAQYQEVAGRLVAWQTWYKGALAAWVKAVEQQGKFTIVMPPEPA